MPTTENKKWCGDEYIVADTIGARLVLTCERHHRHRGMHSVEFTRDGQVTAIFWGRGVKVREWRKRQADTEFVAVEE